MMVATSMIWCNARGLWRGAHALRGLRIEECASSWAAYMDGGQRGPDQRRTGRLPSALAHTSTRAHAHMRTSVRR